MPQSVTRRAFIAATLAAPALVRAAEPLRLRCSLDTGPTHLRNVAFADYLKKLEDASGGEIKTELFQSGQLFPDLDVAKALIQGQVEMACPGAWTQTGFIPDADFFQLPVMYGQPLDIEHRATDGSAGARVAAEIEQKLKCQVLGKWLTLGYQNWYNPLDTAHSLEDLKGLKIRSPGGAGISWRIRFFGGVPNTTAWPNVALALSQGTFDGLVSTNESCASAQLWDSGVKYAFEDHQFTGEYIPLVADAFWTKLSPAQQKLMTDLWAQNIDTYRANLAASQTKARGTMESHGVVFADPTPEATAAIRKKMMTQQDALAQELKISPDMVKLVMNDLGAAPDRRPPMMRLWDWVEQTLTGLLGGAALVVAMVQIIGRYVTPAHAISSAEELIVYLVVWAIMITSSQLVRTDGHVRPDLVLRLLPPGGQRIVEVFNCLVAIAFCGGLVWYGWQIVDVSLMLDETSSTALAFPMWIYDVSLPTGAALMAVRYAIRLVRYAFFFDPKTMIIGPLLGHDAPLDMPLPRVD